MAGEDRGMRVGRFTRSFLASILFVAFVVAASPTIHCQEPARPRHYATTPFLEPDRCATIWVIKRILHPDALVTFHDREALPADAILFDLPESSLKRDAARATVEVVIEQEGVRNPFALRLARLVHDVEINSWATRREPGSRKFESTLKNAFMKAGSAEAGLAACLALVDELRERGGETEGWGE